MPERGYSVAVHVQQLVHRLGDPSRVHLDATDAQTRWTVDRQSVCPAERHDELLVGVTQELHQGTIRVSVRPHGLQSSSRAAAAVSRSVA